jgi:ethanolamine utilization protein EutA
MSDPVTLVGLDFGTTTSGAVIASARLTRNAVSGRTELDQVRERYRSELAFTPLDGDGLDERRVAEYLDAWLLAGGVRPGAQVFGGGALLTGLTARKANTAVLVRLVRRRLGDALIATADDPCLESWLAFMGSCAGLSRDHPETPFLNLDVGGGTTNLALGRGGEVLRTGCLFVGARHVQVVPGTYRIVKVSDYARALFGHLGIARGPGDELTEAERDAVLGYQLRLLEAAAAGDEGVFRDPVALLHRQVAFQPPSGAADVVVTLSGGVGELVYAHLRGEPLPPTTHFGDLGIDLARRLVGSRLWAEHFRKFQPASAGRATLYGLLRHSTQVSGSTLFLPRPDVLPLADLPVLGSLSSASPDSHLRALVDLVRRSGRGGCLRVFLGENDAATVRGLGQRLARVLRESAFPARHPLVLLMRENLGKALGHCVSAWGAIPLTLVVIDEVAVRDAQFAHVGAVRDQVVPVSFFGFNETGETP